MHGTFSRTSLRSMFSLLVFGRLPITMTRNGALRPFHLAATLTSASEMRDDSPKVTTTSSWSIISMRCFTTPSLLRRIAYVAGPPRPNVLEVAELPLDQPLGVLGLRGAIERVDHLVELLVDALHRLRRRAHRADPRVLPRERAAEQQREAARLGGRRGGEVGDELLEGPQEEVGAARGARHLAVAHQQAELHEARVQRARRGRERVEGSEGRRQRGAARREGRAREEVALRGMRARGRTISWSSEGREGCCWEGCWEGLEGCLEDCFDCC